VVLEGDADVLLAEARQVHRQGQPLGALADVDARDPGAVGDPLGVGAVRPQHVVEGLLEEAAEAIADDVTGRGPAGNGVAHGSLSPWRDRSWSWLSVRKRGPVGRRVEDIIVIHSHHVKSAVILACRCRYAHRNRPCRSGVILNTL